MRPEEVQLPREAELGRPPRLGLALRVHELVAARALEAPLIAHPRPEVPAGDAIEGAGFLDASRGEARVEAVTERLVDQRLQHGVVEQLPPREVGQRARFRDRGLLAVELRRHGERGPRVVRADGASGEGREQERGRSAPRAPAHSPSSTAGAAAAAGAAGA